MRQRIWDESIELNIFWVLPFEKNSTRGIHQAVLWKRSIFLKPLT